MAQTAKVFVTIALCSMCAGLFHRRESKPNFITDDEFSAIQSEKIPISNDTALELPKPKEERTDGARTKAFGKNLWTNAIVPYTVDRNFNDQQRREVALAIKTYHDSTCIRFVPKESKHKSWVDILYDGNTCGVAHMCMNSGGQWAKFGGGCATAGVMVHELGHTLCMGHEQTRLDRDDWITFDTSKCEPHGKDGNDMRGGLHKLYDYVSVEHYEGECYNGCIVPKVPGVTKCGSGGSLSVLDIEALNEMYGCTSGCFGYRYVNSQGDLKNAVVAGNEDNGDVFYSCRAYHQGDIIPGKFHPGWGTCFVPYGGGEHSKRGAHIEVLTNPNGAKLQWVKSSSLPSNAIRGGRTAERETLYVIRCALPSSKRNAWTPGKFQPSTGAYSSYGGGEARCNNFEFLVCNN